MLSEGQCAVFDRAVAAVASMLGNRKPVKLYGPTGRVLPSGMWNVQKVGTKNKGSLRNWRPARQIDEALEREKIVDRVSDLIANDPHAAGLQGNFAYTVIGPGLTTQPAIGRDFLPDLEKEAVREIQVRQRALFRAWEAFADAGGRMSFGQIQFLLESSLFQFGEYLVLLPMLPDDAQRPFSLACQVINPLRVKTPVDVRDLNVWNGVELGPFGEAVAYWVKKAEPNGQSVK